MSDISSFFTHNIVIVYFLYGLAFFSMGLAVLLESTRSSDLRLAYALRPLAAFGLMHGIHEWGEMFQQVFSLSAGYALSPQEQILQHTWLVGSFAALAVFGVALLLPGTGQAHSRTKALTWLVPLALVLVWLAGLPLLWAWASAGKADLTTTMNAWLAAVDAWARYTLGMPASALAAIGLVRQQHVFRDQGLERFGRDTLWAAVAFGWYGLVGQAFPPASFLFPSNILNSQMFFQVFGIPVQLFRAGMSIAAAFFVMRFLHAFEVARARKLKQLQETQLREAEEREALRGDLLRQIVTAQEAERQRIARELHDETGQTLTALGLGLRGVREAVQRDPEMAARHVAQLEAMSGRALDELRRLIADLRPAHLDDLGLAAAVRWYALEVAKRTGLEVQVDAQNPCVALSPELNTVLFRIAQEALNNVARHAHARHASVVLTCNDGELCLDIKDDGQGFDPARILAPQRGRQAWGLVGMQERAGLVDARLSVRSAPGLGTEIMVVAPVGKKTT